jgi:hypothetical protein
MFTLTKVQKKIKIREIKQKRHVKNDNILFYPLTFLVLCNRSLKKIANFRHLFMMIKIRTTNDYPQAVMTLSLRISMKCKKRVCNVFLSTNQYI